MCCGHAPIPRLKRPTLDGRRRGARAAGLDANDYGRFDFEDRGGVTGGVGRVHGQARRRADEGHAGDVGLQRVVASQPGSPSSSCPSTRRCTRIRKYHEQGNAYFDEGQYARAAAQYRSANVIYDYTFPEDEATWAAGHRRAAPEVCNLNAAACNTKIGSYDDALQNCYEVLRAEPPT